MRTIKEEYTKKKADVEQQLEDLNTDFNYLELELSFINEVLKHSDQPYDEDSTATTEFEADVIDMFGTKTAFMQAFAAAELEAIQPKPYNRNKDVVMLTREGIVVYTFNSLTEASEATGVSYKNIQSVCTGHNNTGGGWKWEYKDR